MTRESLIGCVTLFFLALAQNVAFSVVSRSRNRNNLKYHLVATFFSSGVWYLTFRSLVTAGMTFDLFWWYCTGTMIGSCTGVKISMKIEKWLGIGSDDHLKKEQHPQGFLSTKGWDGDHFDEARRMVSGWPEWKRNIGLGPSTNTDGKMAPSED